jgi:glycosyltransferase involved in cell wall biosynthesis
LHLKQTRFAAEEQAGVPLAFAQVIVSRDQEATLPRAIESVLRQSVLPGEIVIGDDGSSDGSVGVIEAYHREHPKRIVPLFSARNLGIAANLNRCIRATHADLVSVLAGDDYLLPGKLEAQYAAAERFHPAFGVFYSDSYREDAATGERRLWSNRGREGHVFSALARRRFLMRNPLFSRRLFDEIGGCDEALEIYEDWKLKLELALRTRVKYCPGAFSVYSQSPGGAHRRPRPVHVRCIRRIVGDLEARYPLEPRDRRHLRAALSHFEFMAAGNPLARLRAAVATYRRDPHWMLYHARLGLVALWSRLAAGGRG